MVIKHHKFCLFFEKTVLGDHLVIGLNPPFGKNGALAETFLTKAVEFQPRAVMLISPDFVRCPDGYVLIYDNPVLCKEEYFHHFMLGLSCWY